MMGSQISHNQLPCSPPAIDENRIPCSKGGCARGKEYDRTRHVHRLPNTVQRSNALDYVCAELGVCEGTFRSASGEAVGAPLF